MKAVLITQGLSRIVGPMFASKHKVVAVVESAPRAYASRRFLIDTVRAVRDAAGWVGLRSPSLRRHCVEHQVPYRLIDKFTEQDFRWLEGFAPDLLVVFGMSRLLPERALRIAQYGAINLHTSYLPEYRGPNPDFWQYYDMVRDPGVSVHFVSPGEDTGDVIAQCRVPIPLGTRSPERLDRLIGSGARLLIDAMDAIERNTVKRTVQPTESPTPRARNISPSEHRFLIDWERWPVERVWNLLRGTESWLRPFPPLLHPPGLVWLVGHYERDAGSTPHARTAAGRLFMDRGRIFVQCRDGRVRLTPSFRLQAAVGRLLRFLPRKPPRDGAASGPTPARPS